MFSDLNPFDRDTAILEIVIMLLGAFLIGYFLAWLMKKGRKKKDAPAEAALAAAAVGEKQKSLVDQLKAQIKTLTAQKSAAEAKVDMMALEVKALKTKAEQAPVVQAVAATSGGNAAEAALTKQVEALEKTIQDNKAKLGRMDALRDEIQDLKTQLEEQEQSTGAAQVQAAAPNQELDRLKADMAIQEAATRRYETQNQQLKTAKESLTKERDQALEQLDDLQFRMDKLQRQVESVRKNTQQREQQAQRRGGQSNKGIDLNQLTSLKGLGYRSLEFLESLGINTMERLSETDANTIQHIAKKLDKPVEMIEGWVKSAKAEVGG